jgi:hypothetical protein
MIRRDESGWHINFDLVFLYLVAVIALAVIAIKAFRWALS